MKRFCYLAFFLFFLFDLNSCFGQVFNVIVDPSLYPVPINSGSIPPSHDHAILVYKTVPSIAVPGTRQIVDVNIISSFVADRSVHQSSLGWYASYNDGEYSLSYVIMDASNLYATISRPSSSVLNQIQSILVEKNLGTVEERQALINTFQAAPVELVDLDGLYNSILVTLQPWITAYLGFILVIFVVDVFSQKSKRLIAEANRIRVRKERAEERRQIRNDVTAQVYEVRLDWLARIRSGSLHDADISPRRARRMFEDAAYEYAEYRRSRGWKY